MSDASPERSESVSAAVPAGLLRRSLVSGRIHSAYLLSGPGTAPREAAHGFARALVCQGEATRPCEACAACRRSGRETEVVIDGAGKSGPLYRHVGDHADLLWVERGPDDTRVRIGQIRALQHALHLQTQEGGRRAAVIADAEWLNQEAQNALLRLLEEPPPDTTLVLVAASAAGLLTTVRSRCQRVVFAAPPRPALAADDSPEAVRETAARLDGLAGLGLPDLLDWAEEYRGARAPAAAALGEFLETGCRWLNERVQQRVTGGEGRVEAELDAFRTLRDCRRSLVQHNANPQMVAERALLALRGATGP